MSNYVVLSNGKVAFHPGYYLEEYLNNTGLIQEDFAKRLGTTPKNISLLIRGEQSLSTDIANKLSKMLDTSVKYWLNLQSEYDSLMIEKKNIEDLESELEVLDGVPYNYFVENFGLPQLPRKKEEQVKELRKFLNVSSLCNFKNKDICTKFRSSKSPINDINIIKANMMVQIAYNIALKEKETPRFDKEKFKETVEYTLSLTKNHNDFFPIIKEKFYEAGVNLIALPNMPGSKINAATKKVNNHIMLMINDRNHSSDSFWFTLFHEIGHILNGDYGISLENNEEDNADEYARNVLIPKEKYDEFIRLNEFFTKQSIIVFSEQINRDPGIILGRLEKDGYIKYGNPQFADLRHSYAIHMKF